jgi:hypothetical protein
MNTISVITQPTYTQRCREIRFYPQDVVKPQQSNWIEKRSPFSTDKILHTWIIALGLHQESEAQISVDIIMSNYMQGTAL